MALTRCPRAAVMASLLLFLSLLCCSALLAYASIPSIVDYSPEDLHSKSNLSALFDRWNHRHGKHYPSSASEEKHRRFKIFKANLHHIHEHNQLGSPYKLGLTRFADLTNAEFKASKFLGLRLNASSQPERRSLWSEYGKQVDASCTASRLPSSYDWREQGAVLPIKDQGSCGSCWAFATIAAVEAANAITTGELVSLSEQELVSCDPSNYGCDGGDMDLAMEWLIDNGGVDSEADYPYTSSSGSTAGFCDARLVNNRVVAIDSYADVASYNEEALMCAAAQQPVIVAIGGGAYDFQLYSGGVFDGYCPGEPDDLDHAVVVVGWGSSQGLDYWTVRNSWGTGWGEEGYIHMVRNTVDREGICGINSQPSYPIKLSSIPAHDVSTGPTPAPQPGGEPPPFRPPPHPPVKPPPFASPPPPVRPPPHPPVKPPPFASPPPPVRPPPHPPVKPPPFHAPPPPLRPPPHPPVKPPPFHAPPPPLRPPPHPPVKPPPFHAPPPPFRLPPPPPVKPPHPHPPFAFPPPPFRLPPPPHVKPPPPPCDPRHDDCLQDSGPWAAAIPSLKRTRAKFDNPLGFEEWLFPIVAQ